MGNEDKRKDATHETNMTEQPVVSVVVPCLNRAQFLVPTIESIMEQDYPQMECIVVDGGSTDATVGILQSYGDRISWVSEPDDGHADAINKGWWMGQGQILAWLNADDLYVTPHAVGKAVAYLADNPDVDVVYGDYARISEEGHLIPGVIKPRSWDLEYAVRNCHHIIPQPASFIRRSILEQVNWLDPECVGMDHDLWLRIGLTGTIQYAPILFAYVRTGPGISQGQDMGEAKVQVTRKFFNTPGLPPPFSSRRFQRRALSNSYLMAGTYSFFGWLSFVGQQTGGLSGGYLRLVFKYLLRAIVTDPLNLPYIVRSLSGRIVRQCRRLLTRR